MAADCARLPRRETGCAPTSRRRGRSPCTGWAVWHRGRSAAAPNSPSLQRAYDLLVGAGRWEPRYSLGTFPLRLPHKDEPDDAGWHNAPLEIAIRRGLEQDTPGPDGDGTERSAG
nr:hypothetical protein [Streptomyces aureocirculatus]